MSGYGSARRVDPTKKDHPATRKTTATTLRRMLSQLSYREMQKLAADFEIAYVQLREAGLKDLRIDSGDVAEVLVQIGEKQVEMDAGRYDSEDYHD